jgi:hypothetical protein
MDILNKLCCDCNTVKPITEFYNRKRSADGRDFYCVPCKRKRALKYKKNPVYKTTKAKSIISDDGINKFCGGCGITRPITEFYKSKNTNDGVSARCITCYQINYHSNKEHANKKALERYYKRIGKPMPETINTYQSHSTKIIAYDDSSPVVPTYNQERWIAAREHWRAVFNERYDDVVKLLKEYEDNKSKSVHIVKKFHEEVRIKWKLKYKTTEKYEEHFRKYGCSGW